VCTQHQPPFICGSLFLISEICKEQPRVKALLSMTEANTHTHRHTYTTHTHTHTRTHTHTHTHIHTLTQDLEDDQEVIKDQREDFEGGKEESDGDGEGGGGGDKEKKGAKDDVYDPLKRDPAFSQAHHAPLWEL
jgi:hypothetical protein